MGNCLSLLVQGCNWYWGHAPHSYYSPSSSSTSKLRTAWKQMYLSAGTWNTSGHADYRTMKQLWEYYTKWVTVMWQQPSCTSSRGQVSRRRDRRSDCGRNSTCSPGLSRQKKMDFGGNEQCSIVERIIFVLFVAWHSVDKMGVWPFIDSAALLPTSPTGDDGSNLVTAAQDAIT